jgi:ABC-type nitrate/sulfonate/bicarbonate transport system permease component
MRYFGFTAATLLGVPLGLALAASEPSAASRVSGVRSLLRPIPPFA